MSSGEIVPPFTILNIENIFSNQLPILYRHLKDVQSHVRKTQVSMSLFASNFVVFILVPALAHILPLLYWLPFDPYATRFRFVSTFIYEMLCSFVAILLGAAFNMYMYVVLVCLTFNYELLGERAQRIGYGDADDDKKRPTSIKSHIYNDLIELIRLQLKMNE